MSTKRKITLTDERPVMVTDEQWPVVASASNDRGSNGADLILRQHLRVRMHADGRCLVYGWSESNYQHEHGRQAGFRCTIDDCPRQLRMVAGLVGMEDWLVMKCISALPAREETEDDDLPVIYLMMEGGVVHYARTPLKMDLAVVILDEEALREQGCTKEQSAAVVDRVMDGLREVSVDVHDEREAEESVLDATEPAPVPNSENGTVPA